MSSRRADVVSSAAVSLSLFRGFCAVNLALEAVRIAQQVQRSIRKSSNDSYIYKQLVRKSVFGSRRKTFFFYNEEENDILFTLSFGSTSLIRVYDDWKLLISRFYRSS